MREQEKSCLISRFSRIRCHFDCQRSLLMTHQPAEEVAHNLQQAVFAAEQLLTQQRFIAIANASMSLDPGSSQITAEIARSYSHLRIVANALHLACVSFGVEIEDGSAGFLRKPYGRSHAYSALAKRFQVQVLGIRELGNQVSQNIKVERRFSAASLNGYFVVGGQSIARQWTDPFYSKA